MEEKYKELKNKDEKLENKDNEIKNLEHSYKRKKYKNKYNFDNETNISKSFEKIFNDKNIAYNPYKKSKETQVQYLLQKLQVDDRVDKDLYNYFHDTLKDKKIIS